MKKDQIDSHHNVHDPFSDSSTTDSWIRYAGYTARLKTLLLTTKRYLAYSSDFGEAFRPVAHPWFVKGAYAISWAYVAYDVSTESYKAHKQGKNNEEIGEIAVKRTIFQTLASMALPAFTIHSQVKLFSKICAKINRYQRWGPTIAGLAVVPLLPYLFDEPVEHAVDLGFDYLKEAVYGTNKEKKE